MDKVDVLTLGIARWAEINNIVAKYKGLPGDEDFEWLGDKPLPLQSELLALGEAAMLDAVKRSVVQSVVSNMERQLVAVGVYSPYFIFVDTATRKTARPIIENALTTIAAIEAAGTIDEVNGVMEQGTKITP